MASTLLWGVPARASQKCGEIPTVLLLQDRSGSMKELVAGKTKWEIAKTSLVSLTKQFSSQLAIGLLLYPQWPEKFACTTGKVNVTPTVNNLSALTTALNSTYPSGNTPITASLDAAGAYLAGLSSKVHHVILVTDGKETCLTPSASLTQSGSCQWKSGTNFRKCGDCGWQFCLSSSVWSSVCAAKPEIHPCPGGQTCASSALCQGTITGSTTPKQAMAKLATQGVMGHVIGFGANVDTKVLKDLAVAGGTVNYSFAANPTQLQAALTKVAAAISCCGNGQLDKGELCDKKIPAGQAGACPKTCNDGKPCTSDKLSGADCSVTCQYTPITTPINGDGCCPTGANSGNDSDCKPNCGNGVLDPGEKCDPQIPKGQTGACDLKCDDKDPCTTDSVGGSACNPACITKAVGPNPATKDGCCPKKPANLTVMEDADCPPLCSPGGPKICIDPCKDVQCPPGHYCQWGKCIPWTADGGPATNPGDPVTDAGCDCRVGAGSERHGAAVLALLLGLLLLVRRRS